MTDSMNRIPKGAPKKARDYSRVDYETIKCFVAFRHALGWSQLRTAIELGVSRQTVENWESPRPERNARIPATAYNVLRRLAQRETACDSQGRIRVTA